MTNVEITYQEIFDSFQESLGVDGAHELLRKALLQAHLPYKNSYSKEEAVKICYCLKQQRGFVSIVACIIASKFMIR